MFEVLLVFIFSDMYLLLCLIQNSVIIYNFQLMEAQSTYHRQSLDALDRLIPTLKEEIGKALETSFFVLDVACCFQKFTPESLLPDALLPKF